MPILPWLVNFLVKSNIWVGLAVVALCHLTLEHYAILPRRFLAFEFFATITAYSYMRIVQYGRPARLRPSHLRRLFSRFFRLNGVYTILAAMAMLYFLREIYRPGLSGILFLPVLISLLYPITFPFADRGFTSLRILPGLKLFLIAFTWSYMTVLLPELIYGALDLHSFLEFLWRMVLIAGLVIPFDIRDLRDDLPSMQTLPQVLGYRSARELAYFGILVYQLWLVVKIFAFGYNLHIILAEVVVLEVGAQLIRRANPERHDWYFSFWIEAIPIFMALAMMIAGRFT
jgi:hypothetical protein